MWPSVGPMLGVAAVSPGVRRAIIWLKIVSAAASLLPSSARKISTSQTVLMLTSPGLRVAMLVPAK